MSYSILPKHTVPYDNKLFHHAHLTLNYAAKGPIGLSCFEKQTAKHFLKLNKLKNLGIPGKLYVDYFPFYNN